MTFDTAQTSFFFQKAWITCKLTHPVVVKFQFSLIPNQMHQQESRDTPTPPELIPTYP